MLKERDSVTPSLDVSGLRQVLYRLGSKLTLDVLLLAYSEYPNSSVWTKLLEEAQQWVEPIFPLKGRDVITMGGLLPGPAVGGILAAVETWWIEGGFSADRGMCLAELQRRIGKVKLKPKT
jgi:poly(A) polymerase